MAKCRVTNRTEWRISGERKYPDSGSNNAPSLEAKVNADSEEQQITWDAPEIRGVDSLVTYLSANAPFILLDTI